MLSWLSREVLNQARLGFILEKLGKNFRQYFNANNPRKGKVIINADPTFYPTDDTFADNNNPDTAQGSLTYIMVSWSVPDARDRRCFLKFDTSSIPTGATIETAKLAAYVFADPPPGWTGDSIYVHKVADDTWTEGSLTWNNQPAYGVQIDSRLGYPAAGTWDEFTSDSLKQYVQDEVSAGETYISFCLRGDEDGATDYEWYAYYRSKEYDGYDPYLEVTWTVPWGGSALPQVQMAKAILGLYLPLSDTMPMKLPSSKLPSLPWSKRFPELKPLRA